MKTLGYTPKQAERLYAALEADVAKIEEIAQRIATRVTDSGVDASVLDSSLEDLRFRVDQIKDTIRRRTR